MFSAAGCVWRCCPLTVFRVTAQVDAQARELKTVFHPECRIWRPTQINKNILSWWSPVNLITGKSFAFSSDSGPTREVEELDSGTRWRTFPLLMEIKEIQCLATQGLPQESRLLTSQNSCYSSSSVLNRSKWCSWLRNCQPGIYYHFQFFIGCIRSWLLCRKKKVSNEKDGSETICWLLWHQSFGGVFKDTDHHVDKSPWISLILLWSLRPTHKNRFLLFLFSHANTMFDIVRNSSGACFGRAWQDTVCDHPREHTDLQKGIHWLK